MLKGAEDRPASGRVDEMGGGGEVKGKERGRKSGGGRGQRASGSSRSAVTTREDGGRFMGHHGPVAG